MKKILFAAFAATLLAAGCQKTEVYQPANSGEKMTFSTEMKKITKADELVSDPNATGLNNLQAQGFNVWAYADYNIATATNVNKTTGIFDGMNNWYVGYNGSSWSANKEFYWPGKEKKLQFFAISGTKKKDAFEENLNPANYTVNITPVFTDNTTVNSEATEAVMTISDYEVSTTANDDLMVADFLTQDQESRVDGVTGKVALNFRHTLSKVQFVFKTVDLESAPEVYVQKLTVTKLKNKGTLSVKSNNTSTTEDNLTKTEVAPKWSNQDGDVSYVVESSTDLNFSETIDYVFKENTNEVEYNSAKGDRLTANTNSEPLVTWLMMPQSIDENSQIEVFYLIKNRQFKAVFPLKSETVPTWEENKFTKYTITLSPNLITFDAGVSEDWDSEQEIPHQN